MYKREKLAGVRIDNCSLREALKKTEVYLKNVSVSVIEAINMDTIMIAGRDEMVRGCLAEADLVLPADKEILQEMGIATKQRIREIKEDEFFHELIKRLVRAKMRFYFLARTKDELECLEGNFMRNYGERIQIAGSYAVDECTGLHDAVVNEINSVAPDVICSVLPCPEQEHFLAMHRSMLNTNLWLGFGMGHEFADNNKSIFSILRKIFVRQRLKRRIHIYDSP